MSSHRSPSDVALSTDGSFAITANSTSDTVSLVDLKAGRVLAETPVGRSPFCVALARDGKSAVVSDRLADTITLLSVSPTALKPEATMAVGDEPRGVALSPDGKFVAYNANPNKGSSIYLIDVVEMNKQMQVRK